MHDHVTLLSPARIERGIARDNFTPILSRTRSSGFNVFGLRMGLRGTGLKASEHGGSDARAAGCQSRSGVPYRHLRIFLDQRALSCASVHPFTCTLDRCLPTSSDPTSCQLPSSALSARGISIATAKTSVNAGRLPRTYFRDRRSLVTPRNKISTHDLF
jgi:hypothetical protein